MGNIIRDLLVELRAKDVYLKINDKQELEISVKQGKIPSEIVEEIKKNKQEIIDYIKNSEVHFTDEIQKIELSDNYPISSSQRSLWIVSQEEQSSIAYNIASSKLLQGLKNKEFLEKAVIAVISRHEILRTVFKNNEEGELRQYILDVNELNFKIDSIDYRKKADAKNAISAYILNDSNKAFDLEKGPLLRVAILQTNEEEFCFYYILHHIISDDWSNDILEKEVLAFYNSYINESDVNLPILHTQYKDYANWEKLLLTSGKMEGHREFWTKKLAGELPRLNLPTNKQRPKVKTYNGYQFQTYIGFKEVNELKEIAQKSGGSLFMSILTVLKILIFKYTNESDIIIGFPIANRDDFDLQNQIGYYIKPLALRNQVSPEDSFNVFFNKLKENTLSSFIYKDYPFAFLIEDLKLNFDPGRAPIFDISVTFHNSKSDNNFDKDNDLATIIDQGESKTKQDIEFHFQEVRGDLSFLLNFNRDVYESEMIIQFMEHFKVILSELIKFPDLPIKSIDYLSEEEKNNVINNFNDTEVNYPKDKTLVDLFEEQVKTSPNTTAIVFENKKITYKELDLLSNVLAFNLQTNYGIQVGDLVGVQLERSEWSVISFLSILKAGAVYVPIDSELPEERKSFIFSDTGLKVLITESVFLFDFNFFEGSIFSIDIEFDHSLDISTFQKQGLSPKDLAYLIYTSGSTGNPKGVMIEHSGIVNTILSQIDFFGMNECKNSLQFASFSFDASISEIFITLLSGGTLFILNDETRKDAHLFEKYIIEKNIEIATLPPAFLNLINVKCLKNLKVLITAGESAVHDKVSEYLQYGTFINAYGPTESSICCTGYKLEKGSTITSINIPIGKPIENVQMYVLDAFLNPCAIGVTGELYISGAGLSKGYQNRPDLTSKSFVPNPFKTEFLMYKSGDLGRWLPDGNLEYNGRIDDQVKLNGYRIELEEIENRLLEIQGIKQSVVIAKQENGENYLIAYYVSDEILDKNKIQSELGKALPIFMLPSYYVQLQSIPLNINGKIDKKGLRPVVENDLIKTEYLAPVTTEEIILTSIWSEVLKYENIGKKDNFYNLGGDSIKAILVVSRLKQQGYTLKIEQLLKNPIVEDLAKYIKVDHVFTDQSAVQGAVELTPIQYYFFENELISNKNHYNQSVLLKSKLPIDSEILNKCIGSLVSHHDTLRMVFNLENDSWKQYNQDNQEQHYKIDFYDLTQEQDELAAMQKIGERLQSDFDISSGILFQVGHFRLSDGDRLALIIHHLVIDGVSWRILMEDLADFYLSYQKNNSVTLPLKSDSFQRWSFLLQEHSKSDQMKQERLYWDERSKVSISDFPKDFEVLKSAWSLNTESGFSLDILMTEKLKTKVHGAYNTEINDILLTGLSLAIQDVFEVEKSVVLVEGHGREEIINNVNIGRTVGWFTSVYPFVLDISDAEGYELVNIKESLRRVPNKGIGYGILNYLDHKFENQLKPSLQFNYLGDFGDTVGKNEESSIFQFSSESIGRETDIVNTQSNILLDVSGMMVMGELNMSIRYSSDCYSQKTVERLNQSYKKHLEILINKLVGITQKQITPSDLTYKYLPYAKLLEINAKNDIEDIYELSPLQQGLYYHWLIDPLNSMYFIQTSFKLKSKGLDIELVKESFNTLIARYPVLRTSFNNNLGGHLLQIVHKEVDGEFSYEKMPADDQQSLNNIQIIKDKDIKRGFDLESPILMRLKVIETIDNEYVFIWSHHHILMDGWCMSILVNDFYRILNSLVNKQELNLPEPLKYSTYIQWLSKLNKDLTLSYWKKYLLGLEVITDIPFKNDKEKNTENNSDYKIKTLLLDGGQFQSISNLNKNLNITANTFIQGVWGYLLSRYNNTKDVVFGSVVSGRPGELEGVKDMVGLFSNTIPVRVQYNNEDTPSSFLKRLHLEMLDSTPHHYVNLSEVQSQSILGMDLIKSLMVFENFYVQDTIQEEIDDLYGQQEQQIMIQRVDFVDQSNYDFDITIMPSETSLKIQFRYNSSIYDSRIIENLTDHFLNIATQFSENKDMLIANLNFLSEAERTKVIIDFNDTKLDFPYDLTIVDLFEEQVAKKPDNVAVFFDGKRFTYKELNEFSNNLAFKLIADYGVQNGDFIGVQLHRSEWSIVSFLGILKAGAIFVPIDYELPDDRKSFIFSDTGLKLLITETAFIFDLDFYDGSIFSIDVEFNAFEERGVYQKQNLDPKDLAYLIYTSGSTGQPKGVMVEHAGIANTIQSERDALNMKNYKNSLQFASFSFDTSIWDIFNTLLSGCTLYILNEETRKDIKLFETYMVENEIEVATLPPAFLKLLNIDCLKNLKVLITAGESAIHDKVSEYLQYGTFYNSFGPTESSISCTGYKVEKGNQLKATNIPIGKPIKNVQIYILDAFLNPCAIGVYGELYISGAGLARGYQNRPDITAKNFISNPFREGERMYKSGDMARWLSDGNLEYKGRLDDQVKLHGYRIELGEIENRLSEIEGIKQSVVIINQEKDDKYLVAYYVSDRDIDKNKIQSELSKVLPVFMLPSYYVQLASIPITTNGKIDKKSLPSVVEKDLIKTLYIEPTTAQEIALTKVWSEVLKYDTIGKKDNFYNLGGDSIKSLMVIFKLKELGYIVKVEHILQNPILEDLAKCIEKNLEFTVVSNDQKTNDKSNKRWEIGDVIELSPNQRRFYKMNYSAVSLRLKIQYVDVLSFEQDFRDFISYLPNMTIRYEEINNTIFQRYISSDETKIKILVNELDLSEDKLIYEQAQSFLLEQPFDLLHGELIRIFIVPSENQKEATIGISFHHSLSDAHTTDLILNEAKAYFNGVKKCTIYRHPFDYVDYQIKYLNSENGLRERKNRIKIFKNQYFNYDIENNTTNRFDNVEQEAIIIGDKFKKIQGLSANSNLPIGVLYHAFYLMILNKIGSENKKIYQVFVSGREQEIKGLQTDLILGVMDNVLINNYYDENFNLSLEYIKEMYVNYLKNRAEQTLSYEILREDFIKESGIDLDSNSIGFLNVLTSDEEISSTSSATEVLIKEVKSTMKFDISLVCNLFSNGISLQLVCKKEFYDDNKELLSLENFLREFMTKIDNLNVNEFDLQSNFIV